MIFEISNVGIIKNTKIELNGITVLAGENGTGKSTIEKAVALYYQSLYNINDYVQFDRERTITLTLRKAGDNLDTLLKSTSGAKRRRKISTIRDLQEKYAGKIVDNLPLEREELRSLIDEYVEQHASVYAVSIEQLSSLETFKKWRDELLNRLEDDISYTDDEIGRGSVSAFTKNIFNDQIIHFGAESAEASITGIEENLKNTMVFGREPKNAMDVCIDLENEFSVNEPVAYIDSPNVFDNVTGKNEMDVAQALLFRLIPGRTNNNHRYVLKDITNVFFQSRGSSTTIQTDQVQKKLNLFINMIADVVHGHLQMTASGKLEFEPEMGKRPVEMSNLSSGVKALTVLSYAMEHGCIAENSILILDEPEINLHPAWQIKYAEILVLLQKQMNIRMLITTHSPYFAEAIEVFSKKYEIEGNCKYYLTALNHNGDAEAVDVSDDIRPMYSKLAEPFNKLEEIEASLKK